MTARGSSAGVGGTGGRARLRGSTRSRALTRVRMLCLMRPDTFSPLSKGLSGPAALALAAVLQGCGDSTSPPKPVRLVVSPAQVELQALGETQLFSARIEDEKGREVTGTPPAWSTSAPEVARIDPSGLATALANGTAVVRATAGALSGTATLQVLQVPKAMVKTAGDQQRGAMSQPLPIPPQVEVRDGRGNPVAGVQVSFSVTAGQGTVSGASVFTGPDGRAAVGWTLGCSNENPQRLEARVGGLVATFTAEADLSLPAICNTSLPDGRVSLPYSVSLQVAGGDPTSMSWTLISGALPPGVTLSPGGRLEGIPAQEGTFPFRARALDGAGRQAAADFALRVCPAPLSLAPGEWVALNPSGPGGCGFLLPSGLTGSRHRFAVLNPSSGEDSTLVPGVTVVGARKLLSASSSASAAKEGGIPFRFLVPTRGQEEGESPFSLSDLSTAEATEAFHRALRKGEEELSRRLGTGVRPLPDPGKLRATGGGPEATSLSSTPAPEKLTFTHPRDYSRCDLGATVRGIKLGENEFMVFYQDSVQYASTPLPSALTQAMLDYYRDFGKGVVDRYFGGIPDVNGDGRVVVLVTPEVPTAVAAFVWSGDFYPKSQCPASNQMELVRFSYSVITGMVASSPNYQALSTLVHEVKHVSSLYESLRRGRFQPLWVEEGTAELAGEMSSRLAWAAVGGPAVGATVLRSHKNTRDEPVFRASYGVLLRLARTIGYLGSQPNGVVTTPVGASQHHSIYGSGWHFHRWLGDAYGGAAVPLADSALFRRLNEWGAPVGVQGIEAVAALGKPWGALMEEYTAAILGVGQGFPSLRGGRAFTSYDFPDITTGLLVGQRPGYYPWPVHLTGDQSTAVFGNFTYTGGVGSGGIASFDFTSDGPGIGLEVRVWANQGSIRVVILRLF